MSLDIPITSIFTALLSLMLIVLSVRVGMIRNKEKILLSDGGNMELVSRMRIQANFAEYVPMTLLLLALVEMGGARSGFVWVLGATLFASRITHATMMTIRPQTSLRGIGTTGNFIVMISCAMWLLMKNIYWF